MNSLNKEIKLTVNLSYNSDTFYNAIGQDLLAPAASCIHERDFDCPLIPIRIVPEVVSIPPLRVEGHGDTKRY